MEHEYKTDININELIKAIESLNEKYDIGLYDTEYINRVKRNFVYNWVQKNFNLQIHEINELSKFNNCDTYQDTEKVLNELYPNTKELRIKQLLPSLNREQFNKEKKKYFNLWELFGTITEQEFKELLLKATEKTFIFDYYSLEDKYKKMETIQHLNDLFILLYDTQIKNKEIDVYNLKLEETEKHLNEFQKIAKFKLYKNGNVYISFFDNKNRDILRDYIIDEQLKRYKDYKKNN